MDPTKDKILKITVDDTQYDTEKLPETIKLMVSMYEETYAKVDALDRERQILSFALETMSSRIVFELQKLGQIQADPPVDGSNQSA